MSTPRIAKFRLCRLILTGLLTASLSLSAFAESRRHTDFAKVTDVEPIHKTIKHHVPERSCWTETRYEPRHRRQSHKSYTPTILGTLIGGAIGNEVGHSKTNKKVGAVLGSVLGATLARDWSHKSSRNQRHNGGHTEEVCEVNDRVEYEERIVGYNVTYRYQGKRYHARMGHHPGKRIKVAVHVSPLES